MDFSLSYDYEYFDHALFGTESAPNPKNELTLFRTWNLQLSYAFNDRLTMSMMLPYRQITAPKTDASADNPADTVRFTRRFSGFGDVIVMAQYRARQATLEYPLSIGLGFGFRLPTGSSQPNHEWASGLSRDPVLQVGAGTLDPIGSLSASYRSGVTDMFASALARFSSGENIHSYRYGNEYQFGAGLSRPLNDWLDVTLTASAILTAHDYDDGAQVGNTGGEWVYLTPGLTFRSGDINTAFNLQLPVYQNVNQSQLSSNYVFNAMFSCGLNLGSADDFQVSSAPEPLPPPLWEAPTGFERAVESKPDIRTVSLGERVTLADHLESGKITLFEFYGDRCLACAAFEGPLRSFVSQHPEVVLRKINIGDGDSPVVRQFQIQVTPTLIALNAKGEEILRHEGGDISALLALVK